MSLTAYNKKRDFKKTAEPKSSRKKKTDEHIFVIQRHHASRLHYDFRLEMNGALKSWAVPKGPSLNPQDKRLAMEVEDHPYDYKDFEGEIPPGNYGAGYVYIWDKGTYELLDDKGNDFDRQALKEWKAGSLKVVLHGKKLKGEFALVKMKGREENTWLLIKHRDRYAKDEYNSEDYTPKRVKDKLKGTANNKAAEKKGTASKRASAPAKKKAAPAKTASKKKSGDEQMKEFYSPMLTTLVDEPFEREGWVYETKWDGYRAIANVKNGKASLYSRNRLSFDEVYKTVVNAVEKIPHNVVLDGEVVVLGTNGRSDFQALQNYKTTRKGKLTYQVFDLLHLDGHDLEDLTLLERKALLQEIVKQLKDPVVKYSAHTDKGMKLFEDAAKAGWEGIIAKNGESNYVEGARSLNWLKIKVLNRQEAIICGYTEPRGSRKKMGALILGVYEDGRLRYVGHCGGGFNHQSLKDMYERLQPYRRDTSPFSEKVKTNMPVNWVEPKLVCEVKFSEWTGEGIFRQPIFVAMRDDKPAKEVKKELPKDLNMVTGTKARTPKAAAKSAKAPASAKRKAKPSAKGAAKEGKNAAGTSERSLRLNNQSVALTNQQKIYWPKEKITKGQLIDYYLSVADHMLPYLKDRPQSLHRYPNGINGMSFYQKDLDTETIPSWLKTTPVLAESTGKEVDYLICNNTATLIYMANLGCIEINPWLSRISKPDHPDYIVIDLDPEDIAFRHVVDTANVVHEILEGYGIESFAKTSGASGMHIYIPTGAKYEYETCRLFAEFIAKEAHAKLPDLTSVVRAKSKRQKKVYIDFLQNSRGQTVAAPYSARPRPGATVSTPLQWKEVNAKLDIKNFHIGNTMQRLEKHGDLWAGMSKVKNDLRVVLKK
ncbi:DNA ligase D [Chitinophaga cymbidii]|uniref:DNA ligase (ATP) n=1 Tax=Chitinophaga cymbidii TaxID=1096750 RepID=A0A512RH13_9BACT|nr:DNA ligase D [Chitinophaga cymbidii]GEP94992.1 ATP-dependent DNA ligase [Chitinophaga cymbidii]